MAALRLSFFFFFFFVFFHAIFLLPNLVNCNDDEENLLQGINSYRTSLKLPVLTKNKKAECLADEIAEQLEDQPCTSTNLRGTSQHLADYNNLVKNCDIDNNTTSDGVVMPVCVRKLVPTLVLTNYTHSAQYVQYLNNSKYTGAGVGSEDDWMVVILTTNTATGSFVSSENSVVLKIGLSYCFRIILLLGFLVYLLY